MSERDSKSDLVIRELFSLIESESKRSSEMLLELRALRSFSGFRDEDVNRKIEQLRSDLFLGDLERKRLAALRRISELLQ